MVKISIQKGKKKAIKSKPKPRQKQKQKQSQKVVVNMGKGQQKPTHTPIYIPQSNPVVMRSQTDQSMMDLIKYLKEAEERKIAIQEKEKNELEKEKKPITPEDSQVYFSTVDNKTVITPLGKDEKLKFEKLTGHTPSTRYVLPTSMKASAGPYNPMSFYDSLKQRADLLGENPNTGKMSLSTNAPTIEIPKPVLRHHSTNTQLTDLLRSRIAPPPQPEPPPRPEPPPPAPQPQPEPEEAKEEITLEESKEDDDEFFDAPEEEPQALPEQEAAPLEIITNEPTEAQVAIGIDNTTTPAIVRPINDVAPPTQLDDLIGENTGAAQADEAIQLIGGLLSPTKAASGAAAADDPGSGGGIPNTTKPPYTEDEIYKMTVEQLGQVITANNITDDMFKPLIYNDQKKRIYRANNLGKQLDKPELRKYVLTHYGFT